MKIALKTPFFLLISIFLYSSQIAQSQNLNTPVQRSPSPFWSKVRFGGGMGLAFGGNFTDITLAPGAIYDFNSYVSLGLGLQGSYIRQKNAFESYLYGASTVVLVNPISELQLSTEIEQLRVNTSYSNSGFTENFWNTALFFGVGYVNENVTIGVRYNVLHKAERNVYSEAWMPFVRVYF